MVNIAALAERLTVIGRYDEEGPVELAGCFEVRPEAGHLAIDIFQAGQIPGLNFLPRDQLSKLWNCQ
jgi:hypothetical protein